MWVGVCVCNGHKLILFVSLKWHHISILPTKENNLCVWTKIELHPPTLWQETADSEDSLTKRVGRVAGWCSNNCRREQCPCVHGCHPKSHHQCCPGSASIKMPSLSLLSSDSYYCKQGWSSPASDWWSHAMIQPPHYWNYMTHHELL